MSGFSIPLLFPWMGVAWASLIRSVKRALKVIVHDRLFTEESLYTFLCEMESLLNSRLLTNTSNDPNGHSALTPNHILHWKESNSFSPDNFVDDEINLRKKWRAVQAAGNMFWRRWMKEYLPSLTIRRKWVNKTRNISKGDLVLVVADNIPRSHWPLARAVDTYPGEDGVFRSAKVKTPTSEYIRPASRFCVLEISQHFLDDGPHWEGSLFPNKCKT